jgi:hypothetical protein
LAAFSPARLSRRFFTAAKLRPSSPPTGRRFLGRQLGLAGGFLPGGGGGAAAHHGAGDAHAQHAQRGGGQGQLGGQAQSVQGREAAGGAAQRQVPEDRSDGMAGVN